MTADESDWAGLSDEFAQADESDQASTEPTTEESTSGSTTDEIDEASGSEKTEENPLETPAFEYDECEQSGLHPRAEQWQTYETARALAGAILAERGLTGVEKREFDDAALRLTKEYPEKFAQLVIEARGIDFEETED